LEHSSKDLFISLLVSPLMHGGYPMDGIVYLVGLIVIIMAILSAFGLR